MSKEILKWVAALATGAAAAALDFVTTHLGAGPTVDPMIAGLVVAGLTRLVGWLTAKLPAAP
jgi:hypothetical protein